MLNIEKLYHIQSGLDQKIIQTHQLQGEELVLQKILALQVEVGELANETRCFKFWSQKAPSSQDIILEEYVDGLHFILSIGLDLRYDEHQDRILLPEESFQDLIKGDRQTQTEWFTKVFEQITAFQRDRHIDSYINLFQSYIELAYCLGFTIQEVEAAYLEKNRVNHERQENGY